MSVANVPDIRLVQNNQFPAYSVTLDWQLLADGTLDDSQALATAVCIALGTNALASPDDVLPDPDSSDRCGWWGDLDAELIWNGWPIGSKLWLLRRAKIAPASAQQAGTLTLIEDYIRVAMQPFIDGKICSSIDVFVSRVHKQRVDALLRIYRGPRPAIDLRYDVLWDDQAKGA
jgi:phage gp46-like protein